MIARDKMWLDYAKSIGYGSFVFPSKAHEKKWFGYGNKNRDNK